MLSRELAPQRSIHPSYLGRSSPADGSSFYVSVKGAVRREPVYVTEPKSGILYACIFSSPSSKPR
jgi:hypothetical protein